MSIFSFLCILAFIPSFSIGLIFFLKGKDRRTALLLGLTCIASSLWEVGAYKFSTTLSKEAALFWIKFAHIGVILTPTFFFHFVCRWTKSYKRALVTIVYLLALLFLGYNFFYKDFFSLRFVFNQFYFFYYDKTKNLAYLIFYLSFYWVFLIYAFFLLIKYFQHTSGILRNQIRYFIIGVVIAWLGPEGMFLLVLGVPLYPYSTILIGIYPLIFAYAILKYRLMDIRAAITRAGVFALVYLFVLGIPLFLGYRYNAWVISTYLAIILATAGPFIYRLLQKKAENILLADQRRYQKLLLQAASGMVNEHDLNKLAKLTVYIVKRSVKIKFAAIFIDDKQNGVYRLKATRDSGEVSYKDVTFLYEYPFIEYLRKHKDPVLYEELPSEIKRSLGTLSGVSPIREGKFSNGVSLIIPSVVQDNLLGFLLLGEKLNSQPYTEDDINVFKVLSNQAALAISYCLFLEEFRKAQEKIFRAEKLSSVGGMAEGVAHQIKNRLNHFSVAGGELKYAVKDFIKNHSGLIKKGPKIKKELNYLIETADSIVANVKKTDGIIRGILNYGRAAEKESRFTEFSLKQVLDNALDLARVKHEIAYFPLEADLGDNDTIYAIEVQALEIIYNLSDNGYEAALERRDYYLNEEEKASYKPLIKLKLTQSEDYSLITVSDNGVGIKEEDKRKIFAPFFTTKSSYKSGTGIGIYVVKRMVEENLKGQIWFESEYLKGTTFYIKLPKKGKKL